MYRMLLLATAILAVNLASSSVLNAAEEKPHPKQTVIEVYVVCDTLLFLQDGKVIKAHFQACKYLPPDSDPTHTA